jgi:hypothetical protein
LAPALKIGDKDKIGKILDSLDPEKFLSEKSDTESVRKISFESPNDDDDSTLVSRLSNDADVASDAEKTSKRKVDKAKKADSGESEDNDNEDDYSKVG